MSIEDTIDLLEKELLCQIELKKQCEQYVPLDKIIMLDSAITYLKTLLKIYKVMFRSDNSLYRTADVINILENAKK